jgi:hypothetical protein
MAIRSWSLLAAALLSGCGARGDLDVGRQSAARPPEPPARPLELPVRPPEPHARARRPPEVRFVTAGYGGVGPVGPPGVPDAWVVAVVAVAAPQDGLSGVQVSVLTLLDASDKVLARAVAPVALRVVPAGRAPGDLSEQGTSPFTGSVAEGETVVLRMWAPLDASCAAVYKAGAGVRVRVEIVDVAGLPAVAEGPAGPWATG